MKHLFLTSLVLGISAVGSPALAADFRSVLKCDAGGLSVDVDLNSSRAGQVVIRNKSIIDYFTNQGVVQRTVPTIMGLPPGTTLPLEVTEPNPYELVIAGGQNQRFTKGSDFVGFEAYTPFVNFDSVRLPGGGVAYGRPRFVLPSNFGPLSRKSIRTFVSREGSDVRVRFDEDIRSFNGCSVYIPNPQGETTDCAYAGGQRLSFPAEYHTDRANWLFRDCIEQ